MIGRSRSRASKMLDELVFTDGLLVFVHFLLSPARFNRTAAAAMTSSGGHAEKLPSEWSRRESNPRAMMLPCRYRRA